MFMIKTLPLALPLLLAACISTEPEVIRSASLDDAATVASREDPADRHMDSNVSWNDDHDEPAPPDTTVTPSRKATDSTEATTPADFLVSIGAITPALIGRSSGRIEPDREYLLRAALSSPINDRWQGKIAGSLGGGGSDIDAAVKNEGYLEWAIDVFAVRKLTPKLSAELGAGYFGGGVFFDYQNPFTDGGQTISSDLLGYNGLRLPLGLTFDYGAFTTSIYALPEVAFYNDYSSEGYRNDWQQVDYRIRGQWLIGWRF